MSTVTMVTGVIPPSIVRSVEKILFTDTKCPCHTALSGNATVVSESSHRYPPSLGCHCSLSISTAVLSSHRAANPTEAGFSHQILFIVWEKPIPQNNIVIYFCREHPEEDLGGGLFFKEPVISENKTDRDKMFLLGATGRLLSKTADILGCREKKSSDHPVCFHVGRQLAN